jgi:16S rRNA (uracil1498-N3)-methyltransferase
VGDRIIVLDNTGYEYDVTLRDVTKDEAIGEILQKRPAGGEPDAKITLYQSILSRDKFEWVLQKSTEIGVAQFVPVVTQNSIIRKIDKITPQKYLRWRHIIQEAAEQSRRGRIPELQNLINFQDAISNLDKFDISLIASPAKPESKPPSAGDSLHQILRKKGTRPINIALFIGPEGGFTQQEYQAARDAGAVPIGLGKRILRTETAAVVASALILYELDI